jgi:hypothetical protein
MEASIHQLQFSVPNFPLDGLCTKVPIPKLSIEGTPNRNGILNQSANAIFPVDNFLSSNNIS